eukprot:5802011-Alexandrium_andersonii.AAC.1
MQQRKRCGFTSRAIAKKRAAAQTRRPYPTLDSAGLVNLWGSMAFNDLGPYMCMRLNQAICGKGLIMNRHYLQQHLTFNPTGLMNFQDP